MRRRGAGPGVRDRVVAGVMAALMTVGPGCSAYRAIPLTRLEIPQEVQPRRGEAPPRVRYRVEGSRDWRGMEVRRVDAPFLEGLQTAGSPPAPTVEAVRLDLRRVTELEVYSQEAATWVNVGVTVGTVAGVSAGILLLIAVVAMATKSSCPFVFVETPDGVRFVGEAYSGSVVRPLQRDDLLALPGLSPGAVRLALSNHAHETQYTDRLELWLVDHARDERAVAGADARPLIVGDAHPPSRVTALDGSPLALPTSYPGGWWESDMAAASERADAPLRDGLEVTFPAPPDGATPVLELDAANTHWLDLVLGRMFASFGDGLPAYLADLDSRRSDPSQHAWREREAVNLAVETFVDGRWQRASVVPTPGPAALRHVAVTLPRGRAGEPVRVRLVAGTGFWRIGDLSLSTLRDASPTVTRLRPTRAVQPDGTDGRALLAATDGAYQALSRRGERLELEFDAPVADAEAARTPFIFANGYYSVHAQPQAERSTATLLRLRDEAGSMARFSLDLYRELVRVMRAAPTAP